MSAALKELRKRISKCPKHNNGCHPRDNQVPSVPKMLLNDKDTTVEEYDGQLDEAKGGLKNVEE
jgi:hypothetical protein